MSCYLSKRLSVSGAAGVVMMNVIGIQMNAFDRRDSNGAQYPSGPNVRLFIQDSPGAWSLNLEAGIRPTRNISQGHPAIV